MDNHGKRKKQRTITLRVDEDIINELYKQSDTDIISVNSLVNQVLKRYVEWSRYEDRSSMIPVAASILKELFDPLSKEQVIKLVKDVAKDAIYNIIIFMYGKIDFETLMSWYKQRMMHCSEISEKDNDNGNRKIIFKHDLGKNWSLYHKTVLESICHDILSEPISIDSTSSTVIIDIQK